VIIIADGRKTYLKDKREKAELNEKACTLDDGLGCFSSAKNYEEGEGVEQDDAKSAASMKKALALMPKQCDAGDGKSCFSLAMLYNPASASTLVAKSDAKSKALYKQACDAGEEMACNVVKAGAK
jgi:TPR repeat protein